MLTVELWTRRSDDKEVWIDFTTLLSEYFAVHKNPMSRFDIAHLFNFWNSMSSRLSGVFVAYVDDIPVGCVMIETMEPRATRPYGHEISRLFVRNEYRGRGIGEVLMREAIQRLADFELPIAYLLVDAHNVPAVTMYKKMGFVSNEKAAKKGTDGVLYLEAPVDHILSLPEPRYREPIPRAGMTDRLRRLFVNLRPTVVN